MYSTGSEDLQQKNYVSRIQDKYAENFLQALGHTNSDEFRKVLRLSVNESKAVEINHRFFICKSFSDCAKTALLVYLHDFSSICIVTRESPVSLVTSPLPTVWVFFLRQWHPLVSRPRNIFPSSKAILGSILARPEISAYAVHFFVRLSGVLFVRSHTGFFLVYTDSSSYCSMQVHYLYHQSWKWSHQPLMSPAAIYHLHTIRFDSFFWDLTLDSAKLQRLQRQK